MVITGAASGIGAATARVFAAAGADVVLAWHAGDPHDVAPVVRAVEDYGRRAIAVETDVTRTEDVERLVATAIEQLGRLDVMVANAGILRRVAVDDVTDERWNDLMDVNLLGVFRCFRAAIPHMRAAGYGRLLTTSSIAGTVMGFAEHTPYPVSKAALTGLVRALAAECGPWGITANGVAPGAVVSPQSLDEVNSLGRDGLDEFELRNPVRRNGQPEDIAYAFLYLASEQAGFLTGQTILVDGGYSIG
ncbi:MAG: 3-oxoacyl-[acyl-carrier protein] reductase [Solirubrobacteraceae bacterium]|nr:3-oxoacyl-[acyl-carrier protein] reductase [Solirubrobacteraceae bacterium]MEA2359183.1 3-oxoacyl-[acyl-carrier protein] reductase [Solirubrobacteraceae bacterium]